MINTKDLSQTSEPPVKFGDQFQITASPALVLAIDNMLQEWLTNLSQQENIDLMRESAGMAQRIVVAIANQSGESKPAHCQWTLDGDDSDTWDTKCGNFFTLNEGTPSENNMSHCCFCGLPLEEIILSESGDDDNG